MKSFENLLALALLVAPCTLAAQGSSMSPAALKALTPAEVKALAPKVKAVQATPSTLTIHVGETVSFGKITVAVIDSAGTTRGRLIGYDFFMKQGEPATVMPSQVTGVRPGTADLVIRYPTSAWKVRSDPRAEAHVKVVVVQ
jgi:hypothetical protein